MELLRHFFRFLLNLGGFGLVALGALDSSFLFMPFGNDLLLIALTMRHHGRLPLYVMEASVGSAAGVLCLDLTVRKLGKEGIEKLMSPKRYDYFKKKMEGRTALALIVTCLAPPPFPFTPVIAAASSIEYPRWRLVSIVFFSRAFRYSIVGLLAIVFGHQIVTTAKSPLFLWCMVGFTALCVLGSAISVTHWVRRSKSRERPAEQAK